MQGLVPVAITAVILLPSPVARALLIIIRVSVDNLQ